MFVPLTALATAASAVAVGQTTTRQGGFFTNGINSSTRAVPSLMVLFIFQLPAMIGVRPTPSIASIPGSTLPSRYSSVAPPPVEMWEILSERPVFFNAAIESPPPTIDVAPFSVASATALATASVPFAKLSNSNTPIGPFQIIVFAPSSALTYSSEVFSPLSSPIQSAGH